MIQPIRILFLEDNANDFELVSQYLIAEGLECEITRALGRMDFEKFFAIGTFSVVLSDFALPGYSGFAALKYVRARDGAVPFILVSGTLSEEEAVESLRAGATDYIIKQRLHRLVPAIRRALDEAQTKADKKAIETQFLRSQRIQTIGELSGGIAHDLNNALSPIMMASELLRDDVTSDSGKRMLELMQTSAKRCADMVKQILSFSRGTGQGWEVIDPCKIVEELAAIARETFPKLITIETHCDPKANRLQGNVTQMHQVLMNLLVNARDAIKREGTIRVEVKNVTLRKRANKMLAQPASGRFVSITVSDTGAGIAPEIIDKIFEPFFTTKEVGKGTGLGLPTVISIVKSHEGFLELRSAVGKGTTFEIYFPAHVPAEPEWNHESARSERSEQLLVVDDEVGLQAIVKSTLETFGYRVVTASGGLEALQILETKRGEIDLVVTDWTLPLMSGSELVKKIHATHPELKLIVIAGDEDDLPGNLPVQAVLQRPYTTEAMLKAVSDALGVAAPSRG